MIPEYALPPKKRHNKATANGLTSAVVDWFNLSGYHAERTGNEGRYIEGTTVTNVLGKRVTLKGKRIPSSGTKGTSDIKACYKGRFIAIEIKIGRDRQSEVQKWYQEKVERAGGVYAIVKTWEDFELLLKILNNEN